MFSSSYILYTTISKPENFIGKFSVDNFVILSHVESSNHHHIQDSKLFHQQDIQIILIHTPLMKASILQQIFVSPKINIFHLYKIL